MADAMYGVAKGIRGEDAFPLDDAFNLADPLKVGGVGPIINPHIFDGDIQQLSGAGGDPQQVVFGDPENRPCALSLLLLLLEQVCD